MGFLRKPPGTGPFPAVVLVHGGLVTRPTEALLLNGAISAAVTGWVKNRVGATEAGFVIGIGDARQGQDPVTLKFAGDKLVEALFTETTKGPFHPDRSVGFEGGIFEAVLPLDTWVSFVSQFTSTGGRTTYQLYLNGRLAKELVYNRPHTLIYDQPMPAQIGALTGFSDSQFRGDIDDIRFYNRMLTMGEIQFLARSNSLSRSN